MDKDFRERLKTLLKSRNEFAVFHEGHCGKYMYVYQMSEVAKARNAFPGGLFVALYESFYDCTEGLKAILQINGEYEWTDEEWYNKYRLATEPNRGAVFFSVQKVETLLHTTKQCAIL